MVFEIFPGTFLRIFSTVLAIAWCTNISAQVVIRIDAEAGQRPISPYLYGRNNSFSSTNPNWTLPAEDLTRLGDAGITFFRESGGNNSSKYNWRRKLSSHPDWYNNVYTNNWDQSAQTLQKNFPDAQGLWAFPLLGYAAKTTQANFNDWVYNQSQWWEGVNQNLAGNGTPNTIGTKAKTEGNINLYLEKWNADSTTGILNHWFGSGGLGLNKEKIRYWNMDNEPEIWSGTHDDVMPVQISAEEFMQRYIDVAKKARQLYPDIKLVGPVTANEWQWYNWNNKTIVSNGKNYPWLEFFIKTIADEQKKSGVRLLDVLDIHFYPSTKKAEEVVQLHRVFFDRNFSFPEANGVKNITGSYDNSLNKEYIFGRVNDWLTTYLGANHGVTLGLTEAGLDGSIEPSVTSVWYASTMGEFIKNGVEIFTPWSWTAGMWETIHLFSRFNQKFSLDAVSANEVLVSAYPSVNQARDSMTVVLVNRSVGQSQLINIQLDHFLPVQQKVPVYTLSQLPSFETFKSRTDNALKKSEILPTGNVLTLTLPAMSVTSVQLKASAVLASEPAFEADVNVYPNPTWENVTVKWSNVDFDKIEIVDKTGKVVFEESVRKSQRILNIKKRLPEGIYIVRLSNAGKSITKKVIAH
ncbi:glycoside hydrolase family 44 protein [Dyadobacter psychrotolerans]|uniref:T9SS type A sorting domain-containing protein n=1 Tax=Dyadobacter psychrotolerans TaxID=2541721 RepID=A0A4R5DK70_9BACT|nr:glycoside hydrolase family 44 protein [Dyadobacter psychrotolerans]TDE14556.1 T9SS type A sorting domain-containing protein [Dyadobacter psychrotolerans]